MNDADRAAFLLIAIEAARPAGAIARGWFARAHELKVELKGAQDFVSQADREVEDFLRRVLAQRLPDHAFFGEESGATDAPGAVRPTWIVDPIDGTTNFLRGVPFWGVSMALVHQGEVQVGLVYDPMRDELFTAAKNAGAHLNGVAMKTSTTDDPKRALVAAGHSRKSSNDAFQQIGAQLLGDGFEVRRLGSAALATAYVAAGRVDAFFELMLSPWDVVGGLALCVEAGASISRFTDGAGLTEGNPWLCATPALYARLSAITTIR